MTVALKETPAGWKRRFRSADCSLRGFFIAAVTCAGALFTL